MAKGTIARLNAERGFGFIRPDGGAEDLFFHRSALVGQAFEGLREGQRVEFEPGVDPRDPRRSRANRVELLTE